MRVSDSKRVVFVHLPKTGGATLESVLDTIPDIRRNPKSRHDTLSAILEREPGLTDYWIFGFVRNPWARMVSWWSMIDVAQKAADDGDESQRVKFEQYPLWRKTQGYDFETFILRGMDEVQRLRLPQIEILTAGDRVADFMGRTENYFDDVNKVRAKLGLPVEAELPHKHRGSHGPYRDYYTPKTRDKVAEVFKPDLDAFGYEF